MDRSAAKKIREALVDKRHSESEGEWINLVEFHYIDLFSFHLWGDWPDAKQAARTGMPQGRVFHKRVAYEIKVTRADFRSEMRKPEKRAGAMALSHQFFFATPPGLVKRDEIPADCGLVEVTAGGEVKVIKRAPVRKPDRAFTTGDMVDLLRARHFGPSVYQYRDQARRASALLKEAETEFKRGQELLGLARTRLIREKGHLLVAGSEWIGPWAAVPHQRRRDGEVRVVVTTCDVYSHYDESPEPGESEWRRTGTVYFKACEAVEKDGNTFGGAWLDPGDFLIAFRHEAEPERVTPVAHSSVHYKPRPKLVAVDGAEVDDNIDF